MSTLDAFLGVHGYLTLHNVMQSEGQEAVFNVLRNTSSKALEDYEFVHISSAALWYKEIFSLMEAVSQKQTIEKILSDYAAPTCEDDEFILEHHEIPGLDFLGVGDDIIVAFIINLYKLIVADLSGKNDGLTHYFIKTLINMYGFGNFKPVHFSVDYGDNLCLYYQILKPSTLMQTNFS